jgi:enamine deaminase RidA (YjgF/YER057c/UK114 family)
MKKTRILSPQVAEVAPGLWSNCLRVGDVLYTAGLTARAPDGETVQGSDEYAQSRVIFQKISDLIAAAGGTMDDVVKLTIFVTDIRRNTDVWRARREFFRGDFPVCSLVQVAALAKPEILVEIEAVAHLGCGAA